jgi:hypothetical protein
MKSEKKSNEGKPMNNYESQYRQETGKVHHVDCRTDNGEYIVYDTVDYVNWLTAKLTSETARADKAEAEAENYRGQTLTLIFALEDCIETIEYVSKYVSGQGLSAEDDCQASVKNAWGVIKRIKGEL